ncbi:Uncharacterized lipoprotein ydcL precursor [Pantoea vagans C9-1]|jgi:hypothetical protein|uniref:DUF3313 domain-containing protein n=1 Tax=Pantoea vagans TaxID=470934 RepID=UPI0001E598BA|nr:DUF3313 domain-containing protein [Pantoea vagans]ADO08884.1 Uncharacterized lipoprotein ydcL precursor [Pantoea vagans C9-1]MCJ7925370.1 DUF3313 domain-containing protein [Pantoea vagans]
MRKTSVAALLAVSALLLSGCTSHVADKQHYSGFLADYSQLKPSESASGEPTLRWISPDYKSSQYQDVLYTPVVFYPAARPTARVSQQTLDQIRSYTDIQLKGAIATRLPLVNQASPHTLKVRAAITAVSAENEGVQFYEVVPIAAVVASTMAASGHRTQNSELFLEIEASDAVTGKPLIRVVRKAFGKTVGNSTTPITFDDLKPGIDTLVRDTVSFNAP